MTRTSRTKIGSREAVGSSHNISSGSQANALAIPTRCCCPPDISPDLCSDRFSKPTFSNAVIALSYASSRDMPSIMRPNITFSTADKRAIKLNC